jgi:hypothetical protein
MQKQGRRHTTAGGHVFTSRSRAERARDQVAETASTVSEQLRDRVAPAVSARAKDAKEWAAPRVERGVERGLEAAAPRVEQAVEKVSPKVDAARDKLVDDLLPRLVVALNAAAAAGGHVASEAGDEARERSKGAAAVLRGDAVAKPKKRRGRRFLVFAMVAAAIGAAVAAFKSRAPKDDPWAIPSTTYPGTNASGPASTGTSAATSSTLSSGAAADALDVDLRDSAPSKATADVPGMTADSEAGKDAVSDASKKQGDALTDPASSNAGGGKKKS